MWGTYCTVPQREPWKKAGWRVSGPREGRRSASGTDKPMAGEVAGAPGTRRREARRSGLRERPVTWLPSPRGPEFPPRAFALFGEFRLNKEAAPPKVGKLFCFNGWQSRVTPVFISQPHIRGEGHVLLKP